MKREADRLGVAVAFVAQKSEILLGSLVEPSLHRPRHAPIVPRNVLQAVPLQRSAQARRATKTCHSGPSLARTVLSPVLSSSGKTYPFAGRFDSCRAHLPSSLDAVWLNRAAPLAPFAPETTGRAGPVTDRDRPNLPVRRRRRLSVVSDHGAIDEQVRQLVISHRPELERLVDHARERELNLLVEERLAAGNGNGATRPSVTRRPSSRPR